MQSLNSIYSQWAKAGYGLSAQLYKKVIDLERLILDSMNYVRQDPRLFTAVVTWLSRNSDLVFVSRICGMISKNKNTELGFIIECVLQNGGDKKLNAVLKKCDKNSEKEIFFDAMKRWKVSSKNEIDKSSKAALKWGFYCSDTIIREELLSERRRILTKNKNFAIRALLGPNTKTEIINFLWENQKSYIHKIADGIGLSYQPVHKEIVSLLRNGILDQEVIGRIRLVSLKNRAKQFFKLVPV